MSRISTDPSYPPVPFCESVQGPSPSEPPRAVAPPPAEYAALAANEAGDLYGAYSHPTSEQAKAAALASCQKASGKECYVVGSIGRSGNVMGALYDQTVLVTVADGEGHYFAGTAMGMDRDDAVRRAFASCLGMSRMGQCVLTGVFFPNGQGSNMLTFDEVRSALFGKDEKARKSLKLDEARALGANFEAFSLRMNAMYDKREYWSAMASDEHYEGINGAYNQPTEAKARAMALESCKGKGCKIVQTFHNTCLGMAWPERDGMETALNVEPFKAKADALAQCSAKYSTCKAAVRCSGSVYANFDPEATGAGAK